MKEVLKLRKRRTGQWVTVAGMVLIGACMTIGNTVVFADDTQTYPIEASDSNKVNLTDTPSPLSSENLGTNNRGHEVASVDCNRTMYWFCTKLGCCLSMATQISS